MTRKDLRDKIVRILEDEIYAEASDDYGLRIVQTSIETAADEIMKLWDMGYVYDALRDREW